MKKQEEAMRKEEKYLEGERIALRNESVHLEKERLALESSILKLERERLALESSTSKMEEEREALESAIRHSKQERSKLEHRKQELEGERELLGAGEVGAQGGEGKVGEGSRGSEHSPRRILGGRLARVGVPCLRTTRILGNLAQHPSRAIRDGRLHEHARRDQGCHCQATFSMPVRRWTLCTDSGWSIGINPTASHCIRTLTIG
jgi:hypothetical protein